MPIKELKEPYWEKQEGETPNQYCFFQEYLDYPTFNLKAFHEHLCDKFKEGQTGAKPPAYKTIRKWAGDKCNRWHTRKTAKRESAKQDIFETLHELEMEDKIENFKSKQQIKSDLLISIATAIERGIPLSQINQGVQALKLLHEDDLLDQEKPTNYNQTNIDAETRVQHQGVQELVEAFYVSKSEWDKRKQQ